MNKLMDGRITGEGMILTLQRGRAGKYLPREGLGPG